MCVLELCMAQRDTHFVGIVLSEHMNGRNFAPAKGIKSNVWILKPGQCAGPYQNEAAKLHRTGQTGSKTINKRKKNDYYRT